MNPVIMRKYNNNHCNVCTLFGIVKKEKWLSIQIINSKILDIQYFIMYSLSSHYINNKDKIV